MNELRQTETNAADDSSGRAFGLDGNLYLPVLFATVGAFGLFAVLTLLLKLGVVGSGVAAGLPLAGVIGWALCLKQGKPAGYDVDFLQQCLGGGDFSRQPREQCGLVA
jgi:hypothetical protein